jgi:hypothetical protein
MLLPDRSSSVKQQPQAAAGPEHPPAPATPVIAAAAAAAAACRPSARLLTPSEPNWLDPSFRVARPGQARAKPWPSALAP